MKRQTLSASIQICRTVHLYYRDEYPRLDIERTTLMRCARDAVYCVAGGDVGGKWEGEEHPNGSRLVFARTTSWQSNNRRHRRRTTHININQDLICIHKELIRREAFLI